MDERLVPGIFWPYGSPVLKTQLAYLIWNTHCTHNLVQILDGNCSDEQRSVASQKLLQARSLIDKQSAEIFNHMS